MINRNDITIIIPHFGASRESEFALDQCLLSLKENEPDIKRIVVKNGPPCAHDGDMKTEPQGQCRAVNEAVKKVDTKWILITNDDMIYAEDTISRLIDGFNDGENLCVSPQLVEPRGGAPTFKVVFFGGAGGDFDYKEWRAYADEYHEFGEGELRTGFNLPFLIRKDLWDLIGGYDENFDPWSSNSDSDLEYKIKLAGIQPMQTTKSLVYHFSQTSGTFEPRNNSFWQKNFAYFKEKWGFDRTDEGIWEASFEIPDKERIFRPDWEWFYKK